MPGERERRWGRALCAMWACALLLPLVVRAALARAAAAAGTPPQPPLVEWPEPAPDASPRRGTAIQHSGGAEFASLLNCGGVPAVLNVTTQGHRVTLEARYVSGGGGGAVSGRLVPMPQPCSAPPPPPPGPGPWVAVAPLQAGDCPLADKVRAATRAGAAALLMFGDSADERRAADEASRDARLMHGNTSAVVAGRAVGEQIVRLASNFSAVFLTMAPAAPCTRTFGAAVNRLDPDDPGSDFVYTLNRNYSICDPERPAGRCMHLTSVLFVSISFVVLMIISLAWLVFYYVQRFRYIHAKDRLSRRLCSAAKKALSKIPTKNIKSEDKEVQGDGECCAVCIEPYKISDVLRILPCRHEFHKSCIDPWLLEHRTCPMCKMDILKHYGFVFTGSQESILHMEIEEVVGLGPSNGHDNDVESLNGSPQLRPAHRTISAPPSPNIGSHSSGASSPTELSPALSVGPRFASSSRGGALSSRATHPAVLPRDQVCSNCGSGLAKPPAADCATNTSVTSIDMDSCVVDVSDIAVADAMSCLQMGGAPNNRASPHHSRASQK